MSLFRYIPLGVAGALLRVSLVLSITVLARIALKERITVIKFASILLSLVAIFLVLQPSFIFGEAGDADGEDGTEGVLDKLENRQITFMMAPIPGERFENVTSPPRGKSDMSKAEVVMGYCLVLLAGVAGAFGTVALKSKLSREDPLVGNFWTSIFLTVFPLILSLAIEFDNLVFPTDAEEILLVLGQAFASAFALLLTFRGVIMTTAIWITLALSVQVFFLLIAQYTILSDIAPGNDNWLEIFGAVLVVVASVIPPAWEIMKKQTNFERQEENCGSCCCDIQMITRRCETPDTKLQQHLAHIFSISLRLQSPVLFACANLRFLIKTRVVQAHFEKKLAGRIKPVKSRQYIVYILQRKRFLPWWQPVVKTPPEHHALPAAMHGCSSVIPTSGQVRCAKKSCMSCVRLILARFCAFCANTFSAYGID